ncbi:hypothetical protein CASFOL_010287 [Castilleja foliolosa]|uniref:Uncharacterized protein n=1 Tax=Castilleja foliolosa TaxID=1961234 RepID=A0ABD3DUD6_9LAMI
MDFDDDEHGFGSALPPALVFLTPFAQSASRAPPRRLSSCFTQPNEPVRAKRQLAWVSLQGRLVGADEATSAKTIDPNGALGAREAVAWELFTPIERVLTVGVVAASAVNSNKNKEIAKLKKSVQLRDQVLLSMQQKLDNLCEQVNYFKDQPEIPTQTNGLDSQKTDCACKLCHHHNPSDGSLFNAVTKGLNEDEMLKCEVEPDERRMSDLSDWAPSVASSVDIQLESLAFEHEINSLRKECEQKDITIKELSTFIHSSEVSGSKRIAELEDIIRRKNMIINKLRKDIITLEQKVVNLARLRRPSFSAPNPYPQCSPVMSDNVLYDMDSTTDPSSSDSDTSPRNKTQPPPLKVQETPVQTSDNKSSDRDLKSVQHVKSAVFTECTNNSPRTVSPLKESMFNQTPRMDAVPPLKPKRALTYGSGENRSRRPIGKSKVAKRWV